MALPEKRKHPPSFQHLPINRAKKLKQTWVQNQKIKTKWKLEKRKEAARATKQAEDAAVDESDTEGDDQAPSISAPIPSQPSPPTRKKRAPGRSHPPESESAQAPSLRDRAREAYSPATLHTYRSNSSGKPRGGKPGARGRGQPNMKLRMGVLLETIKRDFT
ncbi:hypothetical protein R3P38DRAFT_2998763 [Favolaschia claudopus]|uniref:rRNA-processing protein FYV7 n=1 Tax=Favolaschia claudopus TaxID=2862362 RepID=A0AAW0ANU6_9AGAR